MGPTIRLNLRIIFLIIVGFVTWVATHAGVLANEETYFEVTAYYSPLPNQEKYLHGSYEAEIRMNGSGIHGASGKQVFPGMIAAPTNYPFGTKIYFEGFGIWDVQDRWGAIVRWDYDRIDIWVWYGDEGRERAIQWGRRKVKGKIVVPSAEVTIQFPESILWAYQNFSSSPDSEPEVILKLQEILTKAEIYDGELDGNFESMKDQFIDFQIKNDIIESADDEAAGYYGKKTVAVLREKYGDADSSIPLIPEPIENFSIYNHKWASEAYKLILEFWDLRVDPESDYEQVILLQELLWKLWEYEGPYDGKYTSVKDALITYQIKIGLFSSKNDEDAGYFWNRTKTAMWSYYEDTNVVLKDVYIEKNIEAIQGYELSSKEKLQIQNAIELIRVRLEKKKVDPDTVFDALKVKINEIIDEVSDAKIHAKLIYLQEIL